MQNKLYLLTAFGACLSGPAIAADASDFSTFYGLYKTAGSQNDIDITADITATQLVTAPGATTTNINGGGFAFNGGAFNGFTVLNGYTISLENAGTFSTSGDSATITKSYNNFNRPQGAVFANLGGTVTVNNAAFSGNTSIQGGTVLYQNSSGVANITNSVFNSNAVTRGDGGVVYNEYKTTATFDGVIFQNNSASNGYGGVAFNDGTLNISSASFVSNSASGGGGALYNSNTMNLTDVRFVQNKSPDSAGAIYTTGTMRLTNGTFENNSGATGGAIGNYGVIGDTLYSIVTDSTFTSNTSEYGGAVYNWDDIYIVDSDFQNNTATDSGGAIFNLAELYLISNNKNITFSGNTAAGISNAIHSTGTVNMNAAVGNSIVFNDAITGSGEIIINRPYIYDVQNVPTGGTVVINTDITNFAGNLTVYDGTLDLSASSVVVDNVTFAPGATLQLTITDANTYGTLTANTFNISQNAIISAVLSSTAMDGRDTLTLQLLHSTNEIADEFTPTINNNLYEFLKLGNGWYEISPTGDSFADVITDNGGTENNVRTAAAWQTTTDPVSQLKHAIYLQMNVLVQTNAKEYIRALSALAPSTAPLTQILSATLSSRVASTLTDDIAGRGALWATGLAGAGHLAAAHEYADFDITGAGLALGAQYTNNNLTIGAMYTYQRDKLTSWARTIHTPTHGGGLYAVYKNAPIILRSAANVFYTNWDEVKNVSTLHVSNNSDLYTYDVFGDIGYEFVTTNWRTTPRLGAQYTLTHRSSATDSAGQKTDSPDLHFARLYANVSVARDNWAISAVQIVPNITIGASYDMHSDADNATVFVNDTLYQINAEILPRWALNSALNARVIFSPDTELNFGAGAELRDGYVNYTFRIGGRLNF